MVTREKESKQVIARDDLDNNNNNKTTTQQGNMLPLTTSFGFKFICSIVNFLEKMYKKIRKKNLLMIEN